MFTSGYASKGILYTALGYAAPRLSDFLSGTELSATVLAITILELLMALGGITVMVGGFTILIRHSTVGRALIWLGGGAGLLSLVLGFGYAVFRLGGLSPVLSYLPYWVGLAFAILGRHLAKGS